MSRLVVKVGGRVAEGSATHVLEFLAQGHQVCVVHGAGPQISLEMERAGIPVEFIGGRRVTTPAGLEVVRASFAAVNAALCAAIGDGAIGLSGDQIGMQVDPVPELGLVGEAQVVPLPILSQLLEDGNIPVIAPVTAQFNVNADSAAAAIASGLEADRLLFLTDVEGFMIGGEVVDALDVATADELLQGGTLDPTILPKLQAARNAASNGVVAYIGRTEVAA